MDDDPVTAGPSRGISGPPFHAGPPFHERGVARAGAASGALGGARAIVANVSLGLAAVAAAVGLRWLIDPWLEDRLALVTLPGAVAVAVWVGGYRAAVLAALAGYLAGDYLFIDPRGRFGWNEADGLAGFFAYALSCSLIIGLGEAARAARGRASARQERLRITLASIGDAVIATDAQARVTSMNPVAEALTGWAEEEAAGRPLSEVFRIVDEKTRQPVEDPVLRALREGVVIGLANHTVLIAKDGQERPIDDSAAPIREGPEGRILGCVVVLRDVSERRRVEQALRRSERDLADFFDNAAVGLHWVGADGTVLRANQAELDLLGYTHDEYVGHHIAEFHADAPVIEDILARLARGEVIRDQPARLRCKDGSIKHVLISSSVLFQEDEFVHTRCFTLDVTDRRRAEEAQAALAAIVTASDDAIVAKTLDGVIQSWNAAAERLFGYTAQEAIGRSIELIIPPELHPEEREILARLRRGERIDPFETVRVARDGRRLDVSLSVSPLRDERGRIIGASKIARDITDRKRADQALRESEERYRALVQSQAEMICRFRRDGTILFVNLAYARAFGTTPEALRGASFWEFVAAEERAGVEALLDRLTPEAPEVRIENSVETAQGRRWTLWTNRALTFDENGRVLEAQAGGIDITERKEIEEALHDADRRKTDFLAMLAHELRNPLAPIQNSVEILKRVRDDRVVLERVRETIERQVEHMVRLVDDLLDVSRITRDRLELRKARADLASIVHQAMETCRPLAEREGQALEVELPAEPIHLEADPVRLAQVFSNLLHNACKYTPRGGKVGIRARREDGDALVSVEDTGIGIPPEELETIFEMFAQVDPTLERSRGGLGIGLTLAKRLVDLHGGTISARSAGVGRGSEFVVRLPVLSPTAPGPAAAPAFEDVSLPKRRILVVDDNRDAASTLATLLDLAGHQTAVAHDGPAAIEEAERFRPDALLLDIGLPGLNGFEVCRRLRQLPRGSELVIIALTGWGQEQDHRRSQEAGFDGHLVKPVDHETLVQLLASRPTSAADGR